MIRILFFLLCPVLIFAQTKIGSDIDGVNAGDEFGSSISLSSDGNILAIGSQNNGGKGQVKVFENQSNSWVQIGGNIDGEGINDHFGISTSLSDNGNVLAIGADANDGNGGNNNGHVRIFENQSGTWTQIGQDIDGEATGDASGFKVSLSSDGTIAAITARANDGNGNLSGHVRVYKYNGVDTWVKLGGDIDGENAGDQFGESLDISSNGTIVAIGSVNNNNFAGHVRIYEYNGVDTWNLIGDIDGVTPGEQSGASISLSSNGDIIAIGAPLLPNFSRGKVRVYGNQSGTWNQIGSDILGGNFYQLGTSLDLSSDGSILTVGAVGQTGRVLVYKNLSGTWTKIGSDIVGSGSGEQFAANVSSSSNGNIIAISAQRKDVGINTFAGVVSVYDFSATLSSDSFVKDYFSFYPNPIKEVLNIELKKDIQVKQINVYNIQSQHLLSTKNLSIDTSKLMSGIYFVEIETNQGKSAKKIVIE